VQRRNLLALSFAAVATVALALYFLGFGRPPQMGADEEVFRTVDALYTAVTARNPKLVDDCEQRLHSLKGAGKLPAPAATHLENIIATTRADQWRPAAERLYTFMYAQRREGAHKKAERHTSHQSN